MGLFRKKTQLDFNPSAKCHTEPEELVNCDSVLEYLVGLSNKEFAQIQKIAIEYRKADLEVARVLRVPNTPTTFINPPQLTKSLVSDLPDELDLEDIDVLVAPKPKAKKGKKS